MLTRMHVQVLKSRNCLDWITDLETQLHVRGIQDHIISIASAQGTLAQDIMDLADREIDNTRQCKCSLPTFKSVPL